MIILNGQKPDETHDSYIARHDVHFEEMLSQGTTLDQIRACVLLRHLQLSSEDRKRIVVESGGKLEYAKVGPAIRLAIETTVEESEPTTNNMAGQAMGFAAWEDQG